MNPSARVIKVRVGEIERSAWEDEICEWRDGLVPFVRASHIHFEDGMGVIRHPAFETKNVDELEANSSGWSGPKNMTVESRIACQAVVSPNSERRLVWAVVPEGCVIGNSVSFLDLPPEVTERLKDMFGTIEDGLGVLASQLNSEDLDLWSKAWAANNNVNNYEIETLPFEIEGGEFGLSV